MEIQVVENPGTGKITAQAQEGNRNPTSVLDGARGLTEGF
jgi:hypothetical protein